MPLPKQVEAARVMVEAAEEAARKLKEGGSDHQNPTIKEVVTIPATEKPVIQEEGVNVLDWEKEYQLLSDRHEKLDARFKVMQGKYNSEVPALHEENKKLKAQLGSQEGGAASTEGTGTTTDQDDDLEGKKKLYGEDLVDFIVGQQNPAQEEIARLKSQVADLESKDDAEAVSQFFGTLHAAHSDWKMINQTSAFIGFLSTLDPEKGVIRQSIIDDAQNTGDPQPIIDQLTAFKAHLVVTNGKTSQVVPVDGGGGGAPVDTGKSGVVIPLSEITAFYKNAGIAAAKGRTITDTEEYKRQDREYSEAAREGRVDESR